MSEGIASGPPPTSPPPPLARTARDSGDGAQCPECGAKRLTSTIVMKRIGPERTVPVR